MRLAALVGVACLAQQQQHRTRDRWRTDLDDVVFRYLDDDFLSPGSSRKNYSARAVVGEAAANASARLPLCEVSCGKIYSESAFVFAPDRAARRGAAYDHTCWATLSNYHTAPACLASAGLPRAEHFAWTLRAALRPAASCRMRDWSPGEAARAYLARRGPARAPDDALTVVMIGTSLFRQVFEAIACRWRGELAGGHLNAGATQDAAGWTPVGDVLRNGGTCTGDKHRLKYWPASTNGGFAPPQNFEACSDQHGCLEYAAAGGGGGARLRLCYHQYGLNFVADPARLGERWGFCRARAVEEIDLVVAERPRREAERDLAILGDANHSCHAPRGAGAPRFAPRVVHLGLGGFRKPLSDMITRIVADAQERAQTAAPGAAPNASTPPDEWAARATWRGEAVRAASKQAMMHAAPDRCDRFDGHPRLPGTPDHAAQALLALLASGAEDEDCCDERYSSC